MRRTLVITGGAGFIGSAVVRHLVAETDHQIVNVDCLTYAASPKALADVEASPRYSLERVDVADPVALRRVFERARPDAVLHLAAETHVDRSIDGPDRFVRTNVEGTFRVLQEARRRLEALPPAARDGFRFLHVSTDEVYGDLGDGDGAFTEASPYAPSSPYAATKAGSDHLARSWGRTFGLPVIVTNCSNNYGPWQFPEKLIPNLLISALEGRELPVYGDGRQVRNWIHVDDHARGLLAALDRGRPGSTYLLGARAAVPNLEIVGALCDLLDERRPRADGRSHRSAIRLTADRPGHDRRYAIDPSRAERELGWTARESLRAGLVKTVDWYLENEEWWRGVRTSSYAGERLGLGEDQEEEDV